MLLPHPDSPTIAERLALLRSNDTPSTGCTVPAACGYLDMQILTESSRPVTLIYSQKIRDAVAE